MKDEKKKMLGLPSDSPYEQPVLPRRLLKPVRHPNGSYGFRLSPEEQELSYELKASMMRKLNNQTEKINTELDMHKKLNDLKKQQRKSAGKEKPSMNAQVNNAKLVKMYEKRAKDAEARIKQLESELDETSGLARRYRDMYVVERDRSRSHTPQPRGKGRPNDTPRGDAAGEDSNGNYESGEKSKKDKKDKVTEDELDDEQALFKRHIAKIAEMKAMHTTSPIRIEDVIRKSEVLILENDALKREVSRLRRDNQDLLKRSKRAAEERDSLMHTISTSEHARADLTRRLDMEKRQHSKLQLSLTRQASDWVAARKEYDEMEEKKRWMAVGPISPHDAEVRSSQSQPVKKNLYKPRKMFPPENYSAGATH